MAIAFAKEGHVAIAYYSSDDDAQTVAERIRELDGARRVWAT
ncbi:MAG: hypothetical protein ACLTMP_02640 [Eggerthella lenta]